MYYKSNIKEDAREKMIKDNLNEIQKRINDACVRCGRDEASVKLIAVSKTKPVDMMREVMEAGVVDFGENYVQELCDKIEEIKEPVVWHMIGHLQTNKVKYIVGKVALIHSVDSLKLAEAIDKEAGKKGVKQDVLIEINIGEEATKTGIGLEAAMNLVKEASKLENIHICGLMCIPPVVDEPENSRPYFRQIAMLKEEIEKLNLPGVDMRELSMGMTGDFEVAIEEGATFVRVGTAIFGARNYNK